MDFEYTLKLLQNVIHPVPEKHKAEINFVIEILTEGQGYLRKNPPKGIVFFDRDAKQ